MVFVFILCEQIVATPAALFRTIVVFLCIYGVDAQQQQKILHKTRHNSLDKFMNFVGGVWLSQ